MTAISQKARAEREPRMQRAVALVRDRGFTPQRAAAVCRVNRTTLHSRLRPLGLYQRPMYDPLLRDWLVLLVRRDNVPVAHAAALGGISRSTLHRWIKRARREVRHARAD